MVHGDGCPFLCIGMLCDGDEKTHQTEMPHGNEDDRHTERLHDDDKKARRTERFHGADGMCLRAEVSRDVDEMVHHGAILCGNICWGNVREDERERHGCGVGDEEMQEGASIGYHRNRMPLTHDSLRVHLLNSDLQNNPHHACKMHECLGHDVRLLIHNQALCFALTSSGS